MIYGVNSFFQSLRLKIHSKLNDPELVCNCYYKSIESKEAYKISIDLAINLMQNITFYSNIMVLKSAIFTQIILRINFFIIKYSFILTENSMRNYDLSFFMIVYVEIEII